MTNALRFSRRADADVDSAIDYYAAEAGRDVAREFIADLERLLAHIIGQPESGSARYAIELGIDGLRAFAMHRYPYVVFYRVHAEGIEIWRVLHSARDIPETLRSGQLP